MQHATLPLIAPDGRSLVVTVAKVTLSRRGDRLVPADRQRKVRLTDELFDPAAAMSSVKRPGDVGPEKQGCDVVVVGDAMARRPVKTMDVGIAVGDRRVALTVHGERVYYAAGIGVGIGPAAAFERKTLMFERCYGGISKDGSVVDHRNPVGRGVARDARELVDTPAPQIELASSPITSGSDRPEPVWLGAIAQSWLPRSRYYGTLDDRWKKERMPLAPRDYDARAANVAHPLLQLPSLRAGEAIAIRGMHPEGEWWQIAMPALRIQVWARYDDGREMTVEPPVDTVLLEPNDDLVELTYRVCLLAGRGNRRLREVRVSDA